MKIEFIKRENVGGIGESEGHDRVLEKTISISESCLGNVLVSDFDLMIA